MGFFRAKPRRDEEAGIEMTSVGDDNKTTPTQEETDYRAINWKRIFLTPKYIRMCPILTELALEGPSSDPLT
jgi:hypothetical protein